ncbi:hypothetical protein ACC732_15655 [Rhizobium ruizarguesonis]
MIRCWWSGVASERYWLEATDRNDIGGDLRAPVNDDGGTENWRYTLFQQAKLGDIVYHYDTNRDAIVARSIIAGHHRDEPIVWAARGTYARAKGVEAKMEPGYAMRLQETEFLENRVTLQQIRNAKSKLVDLIDALRKEHGKGAFYFPFELSKRPARPLQGYAFKVPASFVRLFSSQLTSTKETLTLIDDRKATAEYFEAWRQVLVDGAIREPGLWRQPQVRIVLGNASGRRTKLGRETTLGVDPTGKVWAVQINEPKIPGDASALSAIASGNGGRPYLVRQGRLSPNGQGDKYIAEEDFARLTDLIPVSVSNGDTHIARSWYVVTPLDVPPEEILENTARFVDACVLARTGGAGVGRPGDLRILEQLFAPDETGGIYTIGAREAVEAKEICKHQGEVWQQMARLLREAGASIEKPRHAAGYEVDAEIINGRRKLLVEIKSGASAADVYAGVGQLILYAKLLPRLARHRPVLLLPRSPEPCLAQAITNSGISISTYSTIYNGDRIEVTLSSDFKNLCGIT